MDRAQQRHKHPYAHIAISWVIIAFCNFTSSNMSIVVSAYEILVSTPVYRRTSNGLTSATGSRLQQNLLSSSSRQSAIAAFLSSSSSSLHMEDRPRGATSYTQNLGQNIQQTYNAFGIRQQSTFSSNLLNVRASWYCAAAAAEPLGLSKTPVVDNISYDQPVVDDCPDRNHHHNHPGTSTSTITRTYSIDGIEQFVDSILPEGRCVGFKILDLPIGHPNDLSKDCILRRQPKKSGEKGNNDINNSKNNAVTIMSENSSQQPDDDYHWIYDKLHNDEIEHGLSKVKVSIKNQKCFLLGRLALREGLRRILNNETIYNELVHTKSILKDEYGRPQVPEGYLGSISHKENIGIALISAIDNRNNNDNVTETNDNNNNNFVVRRGIGIDIEKRQSTRKSIGRKVLTPHELTDLGQIPGITPEEEVLLRFSLKECVYKAIHPLLCQYVTFQEAEIKPLPDGTANVTMMLKSGAHMKLGTITAHWQVYNTDYFISSSSATLIE